MTQKPPAVETPSSDEKRNLTLRAVAQALTFPVLLIGILFIPAGTLDWPIVWAVLAVYLGGMLLTNLWLVVRHTGLARERLIIPRTSEKWDLTLTQIVNFLLLAVTLPLCGLDRRLGWSPPFPAAVSITALVVFGALFMVMGWAMLANDFFSSAIRLQSDRGQTVAIRGPYRLLRHPGYVAMILQFLAIPVVLGSLWALIPAAAIAAVYVYRTHREDKFLVKNLPGYSDYARRVRYRLLPGIW